MDEYRGQAFLIVGHQVQAHLREVFSPILFTEALQILPPHTFYGLEVQRLAQTPQDLYVLLPQLFFCCLGWPIFKP